MIDFQDPTLGIQRKKIVRLTADELEIEDEASGARETLRRMRQDEPDGPPPPREAVQPRRLPRPELYNLHGHLMLRPKYLRGC